MKAVYNFTVVEADALRLDLLNRAFQFGDGLFETLIWLPDGVCHFGLHWQRMTGGLAALHLRRPAHLTPAWLQAAVHDLAHVNGMAAGARVRLQVWRRAGGLYTPDSEEVDFLLTAQPLVPPAVSSKPAVIFYEDVRLQPSVVSPFKTLSALPYVLAGRARKAANAADALLLDTHGHVAECVASNVFWLKNGRLYTPGLQSGCVAGVLRAHCLARTAETGLSATEGLFAKAELLDAEAVFCCNVAGIQWIRRIEGNDFQPDAALEPWLQSLLSASPRR